MAQEINTTRLRQGLYRYFGRALLPPDASRISAIAASRSYFDTAGMDFFSYYGPWRAFDAEVSSADVPALTSEYVSLFASGVGGALCPPTESYYVGNADGGQIARAVAELERVYGEMMLAPADGSEAPDHIATELEAMSLLCAREAEAREAGLVDIAGETLDRECRFLRGHLARWLPDFRDRLDEVPPVSAFYTTLIAAVYAFVVHDVEYTALLKQHLESAAA
jgi:TorA maturation chaperone TorD